jgi:hypothetical protein
MRVRLDPRGGRLIGRASALVLVALVAASCASVDFKRTDERSGTFSSTAVAFTFLSYDFPAPALSTARSNAADSARPNLLVESEVVFPYLWKLDWLLEIISVRYAHVTGTWGTPEE